MSIKIISRIWAETNRYPYEKRMKLDLYTQRELTREVKDMNIKQENTGESR